MNDRLKEILGAILLVAALGLAVFGSAGQPASAAWLQDAIQEEVVLGNSYLVRFNGVNYHSDGTSTWTYTVSELPGAKDLSNWVLETPFCAPILEAGPEHWEIVDPDPNAHLSGVKWETQERFEEGQFWVRLDTSGQVALTNVAAKTRTVYFGQVAGPSCIEAEPPEDPEAPPVEPGDETPPTIEWVGPVTEGKVYDLPEDSTVDLVVDATDDVEVDRVEFLRWDAIHKHYVTIAVDQAAPFRITVPAGEFNPTWNQVFAASVDAAENRSDWKYIWVYQLTDEALFFPIGDNLFYVPMIQR